MRDLQVHFSDRQQPDHPIGPGTHRIFRGEDGRLRVAANDDGPGDWLAQVRLDRRGLWLQVAAGASGIHVNGRPVRHVAMLRAGDAIYVDGVELVLRAAPTPLAPMPPPVSAEAIGPDVLLRGIGGPHHGRAFSLQSARVAGREPGVDIRIDDPACALRHASIELHEGRVWLRDLGSEEGSLVNGVPVREGWLLPGDQIAFDARHRFVLEVPRQPPLVADPAEPESLASTAAEWRAGPGPVKVARWPWLLLSALLLAALLSALLWFGAR